ncbi:MAG TPA: cyclic nucleotide-binding domain-containing protein [Spirochaetia bacterium]|nr:cyclic nucleotide-binding domain-containing protein [Spirochaetia bacterium]
MREPKDTLDTAAVLAASPLMRGLTSAQLEELVSVSAEQTYAAGEVIVASGVTSTGVHLLVTGEAEVLADGDGGPSATRVALLVPGQVFGELSALTGGPAISTVRAAATPTRVRTFPRSGLEALGDPGDITSTLLRNVITVNQKRLSDSNANYVHQLEQTTALLLQRQTYARFLFVIILLLGICLFVNHWLAGRSSVDIYSPAFAWAYLVIMVLPTLWVAWRARYPLSLFGLTRRNLGRDLLWSSAILVVVLGLATGALLLGGFPLAQRFNLSYLARYGPLYSLHSALQEFMGRGVMLGMMLKIFGDSSWKQRQLSNLAVSMMFGLIHIHFGFATVGLMMLFSLLLGTYYFVHRNLAGPILIHIVLGIAAFMVGIL